VGAAASPAPDELADAISSCVALVALVSDASLNSGWWHDSLHYANGSAKPIYPVLVGRGVPSWLAQDAYSTVQDPIEWPATGTPPSQWVRAVASGLSWPASDLTEDIAVFRVHLSLAWPIWAGGYPSQAEAVASLDAKSPEITDDFAAKLQAALGSEYVVLSSWVSMGGYEPIEGLFPAAPAPNSVYLDVAVGGNRQRLPRVDDIGGTIERICRDFEGVLGVKARAEMPNAAAGANLYDVISRWDAGAGLALVEAPGESVGPLVPTTGGGAKKEHEDRPGETIFVSYSHRDQRWLSRLQVHLRPLERRLRVHVWADTQLKAGDEWRTEIRESLDKARVAILLVTPDFIASDFIYDNELPPLLSAAESKGTLIVPIIIGYSQFENIKELSRFQAANDPKAPLIDLSRGKQERILKQVADRISDLFPQGA
jgi:hypothetical protein